MGRGGRSRGGGRVGDATGAQGVEEDFVIATEFDVLQTTAVAQGVVGEVEEVIGLVEGQVDLEQLQAVVDGIDQADRAGQRMDSADPAVGGAAGAVSDLVMHVPRGEHRLAAAAELSFVQPPLDAALAIVQLPP